MESNDGKKEKVFTAWDEKKQKRIARLRQLDESEATITGQIEILKNNLDHIKLEREGLIAANSAGDEAIRMYKEFLGETPVPPPPPVSPGQSNNTLDDQKKKKDEINK